MTGLIGPRDTFHPSKEYWSTYIECTELYFIAKNVKDERKVACILSLMGYETYGLLLHRSLPEFGFNDIDRFSKRHHREGEAISYYVADLRKLSVHCGFSGSLTTALRLSDQFLFGLRNERV